MGKISFNTQEGIHNFLVKLSDVLGTEVRVDKTGHILVRGDVQELADQIQFFFEHRKQIGIVLPMMLTYAFAHYPCRSKESVEKLVNEITELAGIRLG
jgi:hypothetical protein